MAAFNQGDVVRVPFPYTNRESTQHRPALVVSDGALAKDGLLLWVAMITSAANRGWPGDVPVSDLAGAGLPAPSIVRTLKLATIEASTAHQLGRIGGATLRSVLSQIRVQLGL